MKILHEILSMKRPHGGLNETATAALLRANLPHKAYVGTFTDTKRGAVMAYHFCTDLQSRSLFVAHLDTVHREDGANPVMYDPEMQWMWKEDGQALGADDGAGIYVLYKMIEAGVPGTYLFTVGEECGGIGSRWMADNCGAFLGQFDRAIAFDRRGTTNVITHQGCGECCSDAFATVLAAELTDAMMNTEYENYPHAPDPTGVYTDTAEWVRLIPECTNISVGYANEHGGKETLDVGYLNALVQSVLVIAWEHLPVMRDHTKIAVWDSWGSLGNWGSGSDLGLDERVFGEYPAMDDAEYLMLYDMDDRDIEDLVYSDPELVTKMLLSVKYS